MCFVSALYAKFLVQHFFTVRRKDCSVSCTLNFAHSYYSADCFSWFATLANFTALLKTFEDCKNNKKMNFMEKTSTNWSMLAKGHGWCKLIYWVKLLFQDQTTKFATVFILKINVFSVSYYHLSHLDTLWYIKHCDIMCKCSFIAYSLSWYWVKIS